MSATNVQSALPTTPWHLDLAYDAPSRLSAADPSIDDPVNDTGRGHRRGDLQLSEEFACLLTALVGDGEEF